MTQGPTHSSAPAHSVFERHRKKTLFAIVLVLIPLADVAGTAVLRWTGIYTTSSRVEAAFRRDHPVYHHGLEQMSTAKTGAVWGRRKYDVFTNSLGFKDATSREVPLETDAERIVFIGDSFTEGVGIEYAGTFVGLIDAELSKQGIEVLNAGVTTYSPVIYLNKCKYLLEEVGLRFDHLVVCLDMSDIVDEIKYYEQSPDGAVVRRTSGLDDVIKTFVHRNTIMFSGVRRLLHNLGEGPPSARQVMNHERSSWNSDAGLWERYGKPGIASAERHLTMLRELLSKYDIRMTLVVYPWPDQIVRQEHDCIQVTHWRDWSAQHDVAFVSLFPAFLDAGDSQKVVDDYFIPGDMHWNEAGHVLVARELGKALRP